jgi:hypothetical protein
MVERGVFPGEEHPTFGFHDCIVQQGLLPGVEQGERPAREFIVMPHLRRPRFELGDGLGVDGGEILECLVDAIVAR